MAIVKLKYLRNRPQLKAHLRYITHRRAEPHHTITRTLFDEKGLTDKRAIYQLIDRAPPGTIFYKMMVNLDPTREDTRQDIDLVHLTRHTIRTLEEQLGRTLPFVAVIHNADHSPLRHMHGIFLLQGRLSREQFQELRQLAWATATHEARRQRRTLDLVRENPRLRFLTQARTLTRADRVPPQERWQRRGRGIKLLPTQPGCHHCGYGQLTGIPKWRTRCPSCRQPLQKVHTLRLQWEVSA